MVNYLGKRKDYPLSSAIGPLDRVKIRALNRRSPTYRAPAYTKAQMQTAMMRKATGAPELKGLDHRYDSSAVANTDFVTSDIYTNMSTTDFIFPINVVEQGAGSWNRVGRKVTCRSYRLKGLIRLNYTQTDAAENMYSRKLRMVIVHDKQPSNNLPNKSEIFANKNLKGQEQSYFDSNLSYDNTGRFRILKDKVIDINPQANSSNATTNHIISFHKSIDVYTKMNIETTYSNTTNLSTIANISTGAIYCVLLTDKSTVGSTAIKGNMEVIANGRLRFAD